VIIQPRAVGAIDRPLGFWTDWTGVDGCTGAPANPPITELERKYCDATTRSVHLPTVRAVAQASVRRSVGTTWSGRSSTTKKPDDFPVRPLTHFGRVHYALAARWCARAASRPRLRHRCKSGYRLCARVWAIKAPIAPSMTPRIVAKANFFRPSCIALKGIRQSRPWTVRNVHY